MSLDYYYLDLAYRLALQNEGNTAPNPSVGAVVIRDNQLISAAFHPKAGEPHAEILALERAGERSRGATLYCTLEPCIHYGKTPPCVTSILQAGVTRVVFAVTDQYPAVSGEGAKFLANSGVRVDQIRSEVIESFYAPIFRTFRSNRPYVIAKVAMTANGIIAPADRNSRWITNELSLSWTHHLRARCDAVVVGADTVILDRPRLTVRAKGVSRNPVRVILDSRFKLSPEDCSLLENDGPVLVCGSERALANRESVWENYNVQTFRFKNPQSLLTRLLEFGLRKVLIEGGQKTFSLFHSSGLIDEYVLMIAPRLLTGKQFLNFLAGPEQSLQEAPRYQIDPPLELDGDVMLRMRK